MPSRGPATMPPPRDKPVPSAIRLPPAQVLPELLWNTLMPFQKQGVEFIVSRNGRAMIADEMGLGKTLQALAAAIYFRAAWPLLIVRGCCITMFACGAPPEHSLCAARFCRFVRALFSPVGATKYCVGCPARVCLIVIYACQGRAQMCCMEAFGSSAMTWQRPSQPSMCLRLNAHAAALFAMSSKIT